MQILNQGATGRDQGTPILVSIDGAEAIPVSESPGLDPGERATVLFDVKLEPGQRRLQVQLDESVSQVAMEILASNLSIAPISYQVVGDGEVELTVEVANLGSVPASPVDVLALDERVATVRPLETGDTAELVITLPLPKGRHEVTVSVSPDVREVDLSNNSSVVSIDVEYVLLRLHADSAETIGYNRDGSARVSITFVVVNLGVAESGEFEVGVSCLNMAEDGCNGSVILESLMPGQTIEGELIASLPQGVIPVHIFAGELEDGFAWGEQNVYPITVEVVEQPEIDLVLDIETTVLGYYADGSAGVRLDATLENKGGKPVEGPKEVLVTCRQSGAILTGCSGLMTMELIDGFGPAQAQLDLRIASGEIELFGEGVDVSFNRKVSIPNRIVVDRELWRCVRDVSYREEPPRGSCGGLQDEVISKWNPDSVITFWVDGNARYIEVFEDVLSELSPILGLNLQRVNQESGADLVALVGVTPADAVEAGYVNCVGLWGCATHVLGADGFVRSGAIVVFENVDPKYDYLQLRAQVVEYSMKHQLIRALVPLGYRDVPDSLLSIDQGLRIPDLSDSDLNLLSFYSNPLIRSGMTLDEVEAQIVFSNDLLEPVEEDEESARDAIWELFVKLHNSGSALYEMRGQWTGGQCQDNFGTSQVTMADFSPYRALQYRLTDAANQMYRFLGTPEERGEYWQSSGRTNWEEFNASDEQVLIRRTAWNPEYSDPLVMLASILWFAPENRIEITRASEQSTSYSIVLDDAFVNPEWATSSRVHITMTVDNSDLEITDYVMDWKFNVRGLLCDSYYVEAELIEYDAAMFIPSPVRSGSSIVE